MFGLIETGEYHKWLKRRQNPNLPPDFIASLNVLVVGAGSVGKRHLANALGLGIKKISVVDPREDRRKEVCERFGDMPTYSTEEEAYKKDNYSVVIIASPPVFHLASAKKALKAGAHIFLEKNISHQTTGVEEFLKAADKAKRIVAVSFVYRFYDTLQYIKKLLESGVLGKVFSAQMTFSEYLPDWHSWEKPKDWYDSQKSLGGSELYGENHTVDLARWFFGEVKEVSAFVGRVSEVTVDTDDLAEVTLEHKSEVISQIHLDMIGRKHRKDMWIMGEKGTIFWDSYMGGNKVEWYQAESGKTEVFIGKLTRNDAFTNLLIDFLECVKTGRQPVINGWEAFKTLAATAASDKASKLGKRLKIK